MFRFFLCISFSWLLITCNNNKAGYPHVLIETSMGDIEVEMYTDKAPKTAGAFLQYVDSGVYKKCSFYRVILEESSASSNNTGVIQGGTWPSENNQFAFVKKIEHEPTSVTRLSHTSGTISMARGAVGTASTEFFICIGDQTHFDYGGPTPADGQGMAAFGKVVKGMNIVRKIQMKPYTGDSFNEKIEIQNIRRM